MITPLPSDPRAILSAEQLRELFSGRSITNRGKGCNLRTAGIPRSAGQSPDQFAAPTPAHAGQSQTRKG